MEIWKDLNTGKYYVLNDASGIQNSSNRYGGSTHKFIPYNSGFPHKIQPSDPPKDNLYSVQPKKFDGYSQFPRPRIKSSISIPYVDKFIIKKTKIPNDINKIPQPLRHLSLSAVDDKSITPPKHRPNINRGSVMEMPNQSIQDLKATLQKQEKRELKTFVELSNKLKHDIKFFQPYTPKVIKEEKRKLKGFFMNEYPTSGELFQKDLNVRKVTNPTLFEKLKYNEMIDRKQLEKRREQRSLRLK